MSSLTELLDDITVVKSCPFRYGIRESRACGKLERKQLFLYPEEITKNLQYATRIALQGE